MAFLVVEILKNLPEPIAVRDLAGMISKLDSRREQANLESRIRRALIYLEQEQLVLKESRQIERNLHRWEYRLNTEKYEQRQTLPEETDR